MLAASDGAAKAIFPGNIAQEGGSVANKVQIALIDVDADCVTKVAEAGRTAMAAKLREVGQEVFDRIETQSDGLERELAERHIEQLMEFMWAATPVGDAGYRDARAQTERLLAARKNSRSWPQADDVKAGIPKSSLDGFRESVISEHVYKKYSDMKRRKVFGTSGNEKLCGVGLLKRNGRDPQSGNHDDVPVFHSAAHIASAPTRVAMAEAAKNAWQRYLSELQGIGVPLNDHYVRISGDENTIIPMLSTEGQAPKHITMDGGLLFESRLNTLIKNSLEITDKKQLDEKVTHAKKALRNVTFFTGEPYPYFAMLLADGDKMGVALDTMNDAETHRQFSEKLEREFAGRAQEIVGRHGGSLIYAGGDDVLGIVPITTALACAKELKDQFAVAMEDVNNTKIPTLSVGIAIAHFLEPFANVREFAKTAERAAKNDAGRNALAVLVKKRGSAAKMVYGKWDDKQPLHERLNTWAQMQADGHLPNGFAFHLEDIVESLAPRSEKVANPGEFSDMVRALVKRVIRRRKIDSSIAQQAEELFDNYLIFEKGDPFKAVMRMSKELQIASEFGAAKQASQPRQNMEQGAAE